MVRKINDLLLDDAQRFIEEGFTLNAAAKIIGHGADIVSKRLRTRGFQIPNPHKGKPSPNRRKEWALIVTDYLAGMSTLAIRQKYDCAGQTVRTVLIKNKIKIRNGREANLLRMARTNRQGRIEMVKAAREKRAKNMEICAKNNLKNPAVGMGEREIGKGLEQRGYIIERQKIIKGYLIDITIGNIAVEIKYSRRLGFSVTYRSELQRGIEFIKAGYKIIYVVLNNRILVENYLDDVISLIEEVYRNPASDCQYWVIRCRFDNEPIGEPNRYKRPRIFISPNLSATIEKGNLC